jgi:hypothetical protein
MSKLFGKLILKKNVAFGMLRHVALVRTDVSEECGNSVIRVTRIDELETTLTITINRCTLRINTSQKMAFITVTAVRTKTLH